MKIALVSQEYPPETAHGGIATQTYMRAHGLTSLGHEVYVVSHSIDNNKHEYMDGSVHVTRIPGCYNRLRIYSEAVQWLTYSTEVAVAISNISLGTPLDLVVFPEYGGEGYIHLINQTDSNHIPSVVHIHGPLVMFANTMNWPEKNSEFYRVGSMMESTCLRLANAISASNKCSAKWCADAYGFEQSKMQVLYTGIDTSHFYPRAIPKAIHPTIIFVGSVRRTKGVHLLLEAACILAKDFPNLKVKIIGNGDPSILKELKVITAQAGVPEQLSLPGHIGRDELPYHLSDANFFAAPSVYEGGPGNVYLEAMACGIPVIACSGSGIDGIVTNMENGFLISPNNLSELIQAMRTLLENKNLCEALGKNARDYVLKEADSRQCMRKLESFYQSVSTKSFLKTS